jgi:glycosyltransferase involved in cell wall biosynthesis
MRRADRPIALFWGVVDTRLDTDWCMALATALGGTVVLVGPAQAPDPRLREHRRIVMPGPADYQDLPALAREADVLIMGYADLPVTRAMQPLKFKEYLATGKPVVARQLPATAAWADAADLVTDSERFVQTVVRRAAEGVPADQLQARERLARESWDEKARQFERWLPGEAP